jgi:serine/threonine protein kinase
LVDDQIRIKVCDFGIARVKSAQIMSVKGTSDWMAPVPDFVV